MPRKNRPAAPQPQAPQQNWPDVGKSLRALQEFVGGARIKDLMGKLQEFVEQQRETRGGNPSLREIAETLRQYRSGQFATLAALVRNRIEPTAIQQKKRTRWRVKIPHAAEAIDQMLAERQADPHKFRLAKTQHERVIEILKKEHRVRVADKQRKTLSRMITERIAERAGQT